MLKQMQFYKSQTKKYIKNKIPMLIMRELKNNLQLEYLIIDFKNKNWKRI